MFHKVTIESNPLQTYSSALIFSPRRSLVKHVFGREAPDWVTMKTEVDDDWSPCLMTLENLNGLPRVEGDIVSVSHDSKSIGCAITYRGAGSPLPYIQIWDAISGQCQQTLIVKASIYQTIEAMAFSQDSTELTVLFSDTSVRIYNIMSMSHVQIRVPEALSKHKGLSVAGFSRCLDSASGTPICKRLLIREYVSKNRNSTLGCRSQIATHYV